MKQKQTKPKRPMSRGVEMTDEFIAGINAVADLLFKQYLKEHLEKHDEQTISEDKDAQ